VLFSLFDLLMDEVLYFDLSAPAEAGRGGGNIYSFNYLNGNGEKLNLPCARVVRPRPKSVTGVCVTPTGERMVAQAGPAGSPHDAKSVPHVPRLSFYFLDICE